MSGLEKIFKNFSMGKGRRNVGKPTAARSNHLSVIDFKNLGCIKTVACCNCRKAAAAYLEFVSKRLSCFISNAYGVLYIVSFAVFLVVEIKTKAMRTAVYISLILIACMNIAYTIYCRRVLF